MKTKIITLIIFLVLPMIILAQNQDQYYLYNIIEVPSSIDSKNFTIKVDNGQNIEKLKDTNGKSIKFKTRASVLMYFQSLGWEMAGVTTRSSGSSFQGTGSSTTYTYWIIRKPITKEEAIQAAENVFKENDNHDEGHLD